MISPERVKQAVQFRYISSLGMVEKCILRFYGNFVETSVLQCDFKPLNKTETENARRDSLTGVAWAGRHPTVPTSIQSTQGLRSYFPDLFWWLYWKALVGKSDFYLSSFCEVAHFKITDAPAQYFHKLRILFGFSCGHKHVSAVQGCNHILAEILQGIRKLAQNRNLQRKKKTEDLTGQLNQVLNMRIHSPPGTKCHRSITRRCCHLSLAQMSTDDYCRISSLKTFTFLLVWVFGVVMAPNYLFRST